MYLGKEAGYLRDHHGRHREVISAGGVEPLFDLLGSRLAMVLNVAGLGVAVKRLQVEEFRDIRMGGRAVVALVEVVGQDLPVVFAVQLIRAHEIVVVEVIGFVPFLLVDILEMLFPRHLRGLLRIQIDPDEAIHIDLDMDSEEAVLVLVDPVLEAGRFGQFAIQAVGPSVVSAGQDLGVP